MPPTAYLLTSGGSLTVLLASAAMLARVARQQRHRQQQLQQLPSPRRQMRFAFCPRCADTPLWAPAAQEFGCNQLLFGFTAVPEERAWCGQCNRLNHDFDDVGISSMLPATIVYLRSTCHCKRAVQLPAVSVRQTARRAADLVHYCHWKYFATGAGRGRWSSSQRMSSDSTCRPTPA